MTTIRDALRDAVAQLPNSPTPQLDARVLLRHLLDVDGIYLTAHSEERLSAAQRAQFTALIARRTAGEPIAYIVGEKAFYGRAFFVTPDVLIPRPETEHLIEAALHWVQGLQGLQGLQRTRGRAHLIAADIGTGSGAIAITLKAELRADVTMHAVDISTAALAIAQRNAARQQTDIHFHAGSLAQPLIAAGVCVDLLAANLPYIERDVLPTLDVAAHEPLLALDGGEDGLDLVRELLQQAAQICADGALILLEIGHGQGAAVIDFARQVLALDAAEVLNDLAGLERVVRLQLA